MISRLRFLILRLQKLKKMFQRKVNDSFFCFRLLINPELEQMHSRLVQLVFRIQISTKLQATCRTKMFQANTCFGAGPGSQMTDFVPVVSNSKVQGLQRSLSITIITTSKLIFFPNYRHALVQYDLFLGIQLWERIFRWKLIVFSGFRLVSLKKK